MRKALLFMVFINSITFVPNGLAMEEKKEDVELENQETESWNTSQRRKRRSRCLETGKIAFMLTALTLIMVAGTAPPFITIEAQRDMNKAVSPLTVYSGNITENPDCTYSPYSNPELAEYMKGKCKKSKEGFYDCTLEKCEGADKYKKHFKLAQGATLFSLAAGLFFSSVTACCIFLR